MFQPLCIVAEIAVLSRFFWRSFKALQIEDEEAKGPELLNVCKYWTVYGFLHFFEIYLEIVVSWFPFYYTFKLFVLFLLFFPQLNGTEIVYGELLEKDLIAAQEYIDPLEAQITGLWIGVGSLHTGFFDSIANARTTSVNFVSGIHQGIIDRKNRFNQGVSDQIQAVADWRDRKIQGVVDWRNAVSDRIVKAFTFRITFPSFPSLPRPFWKRQQEEVAAEQGGGEVAPERRANRRSVERRTTTRVKRKAFSALEKVLDFKGEG